MSAIAPKKILIAEDHADSATVMKKLLQRQGYEVSLATQVSEALALAEKENALGVPFDLVISDLGLPDASGFDLMKKIRVHQPMPGIAMSGYSQPNDVRNAMDAGFSKHLTKPIDFQQLKTAIEDLLVSPKTSE